MTTTTECRGSVIAVAIAIYGWLEKEEQIEIVPWICKSAYRDSWHHASDTNDEFKIAEYRGYKKCLTELRDLIEHTSGRLKELDGD